MSDKVEPKQTPLSEKIKRVIYFSIAVLLIIGIFQNRQPVETTLLWETVTMPRWMALLGTLAIGFFLGTMFGKRLLPGGRKK